MNKNKMTIIDMTTTLVDFLREMELLTVPLNTSSASYGDGGVVEYVLQANLLLCVPALQVRPNHNNNEFTSL